MCLTFYTRS